MRLKILHRPWRLGIGFLILLMSCSEIIVSTKVITFEVGPTANQNSPLALDLVVIYDDKLTEVVLKLPAKDWFEKREQLKLDNPATLHTWQWELVPGQTIPFFTLPADSKRAKAVVVFANYQTPGPHRVRLDPFEGVIVRLLENELVVLPLVRK